LVVWDYFLTFVEVINQLNQIIMKQRLIALLEIIGGNATHLKIVLSYNIGGWNYFSGTKEGRGLFLSVSPVSRSTRESGLVCESYSAFSGTKIQVIEMARFNQKTLDTFEIDQELLDELINNVLTKNSLTLKVIEPKTDVFETQKRVAELDAMNNQSPLDSGINENY
jgi:hypothetical protein